MRSMREIRNMNFLRKRLNYWFIRQISKKWLPIGQDLKTYEIGNYKSFIESVHSHVYDSSFVENRIAMLPNYTEISINNFKDSHFIKQFIYINSERDDRLYKDEIENRGFISITPIQMSKIDKAKEFKWGNICKKVQRINYNQFHWWPIRNGVRTGPNGKIIELISCWEFTKE